MLEINGADVAGAKSCFGVSLPAEGAFAFGSPEKKYIQKDIQDWM